MNYEGQWKIVHKTLHFSTLKNDFQSKISRAFSLLHILFILCFFPINIYLLKVNDRNTRDKCEICSKLTIKHYFTPYFNVFIALFEQVNAYWVTCNKIGKGLNFLSDENHSFHLLFQPRTQSNFENFRLPLVAKRSPGDKVVTFQAQF